MPSQKVIITKSKLDDLASAISNKSGANIPLTIDLMTTAVENISTSGSSINLQTKNVTPTESSLTITPDSGYNGLSSVSVGAISTTYVGSGIARKSSSDLTNSNLTVTAPAGYYELAATKTVTDANLIAGNIKNGTSIFGVTGTYETPFEAPTFTLTLTNNWTTLTSITCDKTYSECVNYTSYNNNIWYARILWTDGTYTLKLSGAIYHDNNTANSPYYCYVETVTEGIASYKIIYTSNGTITWEENPIDLIDCPVFTLTSSGNTYSVTCNKTYSECIDYISNGMVMADVILESAHIPFACMNLPANNTIVYSISMIDDTYGIQVMKITYASSGTLSYEESMINKLDSSTLTASGATVTAPAGYYPVAATKTITSGSAATPATSITANPSITVSSNGLITATASATKSVTPTVSAGYVSSGTAGTITVSGSNTSLLSTKAAATITPGTSNQTIASGTYLTGTQTISGDTNLVAGNIISGKTIFGVAGSVVILHYYTGSGTPSSSIGENGDIYLKTS